ncbi:MAG: Omp28-related outer membrane protein [Prevotella sp.]|nr:Omp28-related outer membrane protein [Prevotella sp.]
MRKTLIILLMLTVAVVAAMSQPSRVEGLSSTQRLLGYTLTDDIDVHGATFGQVGTYSVGAALNSEVLKPYVGCRVVGMRIAVAMNLGRQRTFIYDANNNFALLVEQKQRLYDGWNNIFFNGDGYVINGTERLFFGFDYEETQEMVDADQGGLACVGTDTEGAFYLYGDYSQGMGLYSISGAGKLCVQLIIDVSSLPQNDMAFTYMDAGFKYKQPGEDIEIMATFINVGRDSIRNYDLRVMIDETAYDFHRELSLPDGLNGTWTGTVSLDNDIAIGMHTLTIMLTKANGQPLDNTEGKQRTVNFAVYRDTLQRSQVYLEVYTDSESFLSAMLNTTIAAVTSSFNRVSVVNVHRQGTPLAISEAAYLEQLYAYTYPSFTINRSYFPGEAYIAYDMNDYLPVVGTDLTAAIMGDMVVQDLYSPSFAGLQLSGHYDEQTRLLTLDAQGRLLPEAAAIYGDVALTLMLTENDVHSTQMVYNTKLNRAQRNTSYAHNNVLRAYVTPPTGTAIDCSGSSYTAHYETVLDNSWKAENMNVVAVLTKAADEVTDDNVMDMDIINAASLSLEEMNTQGIETAVTTASEAMTYGIDGRRLTRPSSGLNIIRHSDGTVRKVMRR